MAKPERVPPPTPFQRFTEFAKRVITVPKSEVDEQAKKWRRRQKSKKKHPGGRRASNIIVLAVLTAGATAVYAQTPDRFVLWTTSSSSSDRGRGVCRRCSTVAPSVRTISSAGQRFT